MSHSESGATASVNRRTEAQLLSSVTVLPKCRSASLSRTPRGFGVREKWSRPDGRDSGLASSVCSIPRHSRGPSASVREVPPPGKTRLQRAARRLGNPLRMWPLRLGLPSPPYTRRNAIIVETIGRRSGRRRRVPVGFLEENGGLIVVAEDGLRTSWVRNALDRDGRLRVFFRGKWRDAHLTPRPGDPEIYLRRMNKAHAAFVRMGSSVPTLVEITPE